MTRHLWPYFGLTVLISCGVGLLVIRFWSSWSAFVLLGYALYLSGAVIWMPSKSLLGISISTGLAFGLLIPFAFWLARTQ